MNDTGGIAVGVWPARGFGPRLRGLIGRPEPAPGEGVLIAPCKQVHTFFMGYPIDVLHLDAGCRVVRLVTLSPWTVGPFVVAARAVLELRAGEAARLGIAGKSRIDLLDLTAGGRPLSLA